MKKLNKGYLFSVAMLTLEHNDYYGGDRDNLVLTTYKRDSDNKVISITEHPNAFEAYEAVKDSRGNATFQVEYKLKDGYMSILKATSVSGRMTERLEAHIIPDNDFGWVMSYDYKNVFHLDVNGFTKRVNLKKLATKI